jgi:NAD+ synthase
MIQNFKKLEVLLARRAKELAKGCRKVFVAVSGGIDSSLVAAILCKAFGAGNVVGVYRNIRSNPQHLKDVKLLQSVFGFKLLTIDGDPLYDALLKQLKKEFKKNRLPWVEENTVRARQLGFTNAYSSMKSRFMTPVSGFVAKAIDNGNGRVFGTGNGEEDGILRYFDKFGDGAVDNNILNGLTKAEVRQLAAYMGVPGRIVTKKPSADLESCGDVHNDEDQLTQWAKKMRLNISISYGASDGSYEGNIAWGWKEDIKKGVVVGKNADKGAKALARAPFRYSKDQINTILFLRGVEKSTRHKVGPIPGLARDVLLKKKLVD